MKEFWSSCAAIVVIAVVAWFALNALDMSAISMFSTASVRH